MGGAVLKHFLTIFFYFVLFLGAALAERRVALVIGNSDYQNVPRLQNPKNDADGMTRKLSSLGFEVTTGVDLSLTEMRTTIHSFVKNLKEADLALFFYAGHGLQVNGSNYLVPIDARLGSYLDLEFEAMPANLILSAMERSANVNLVFLDACRDNPLAENLARSMGTRSGSVGKGLAKIGSGVGTLISFATQPGNVALDGRGANSPFTSSLLKHLGTPGLDITRELVLVRRDVLAATNGKQVPWENSSLTGEVILRQQDPQIPIEPKVDPQIELAFWNSIKDSKSAAYFKSYLKRYPEGQFAEIANLRIQEIKDQKANEIRAHDNQKDAIEVAYWQSIQNALEPAMFESYLSKYPEGVYAHLARLKIAALKKQNIALSQEKAQNTPSPGSGPAEPLLPAAPIESTQQVASLPAMNAPQAPQIEFSEKQTDTKELARAMQTELNRLGCSVGQVDGIWGKRSKNALKTYTKEAGLEFSSLDPSPESLEKLTQSKGRVCPLVCGRSQELKNGKCVAVREPAGNKPAIRQNVKPAKSASSCPNDPTAESFRYRAKRQPGSDSRYYTHPCGRSAHCTSQANLPRKCFWQ